MNQQILRGARLGNAVVQDDDVRIEIRCDFTESIRAEMDWAEPNLKSKLTTFDDELGGGHMRITADQNTLEKGTGEIAFPYDSASGFRCVRCKDKGQESYRYELRFHICSTAPEAVESARAYKRTVKKGVGQLRIGTLPAAEEAPPLLKDQHPDHISNVVGMQAGKRGRPSKNSVSSQIRAAAAAEEPSVEVVPEELEQVGSIIENSLESAGSDRLH